MRYSIQQYVVTGKFQCLGAECPDSCCHSWDMPADARQIARMQSDAPELLDTIDREKHIMKRDDAGNCTQWQGGLCNIHAKYGADFLSNSCHFYPRMLHPIAGERLMAGAISCPEMLRLALTMKAPFAIQAAEVDRPAEARRDLLPGGCSPSQAEAIMASCQAIAADETKTPEQIMMQLLTIAEQLSAHPVEMWGQLNFDVPPSAAEPNNADAHGIYYALVLTGAFAASGVAPRLRATMAAMEQARDCAFDNATRELKLGPKASSANRMLTQRWKADAARALAPSLRRWIGAQLAIMAFPFGGFGAISIAERAAVLVQRFVTIRLALMCHVEANATPPDEETVIRVIQSIARFMDHLGDAKLTLMIHRDSGWTSSARLRGLIVGV